MKNFRRVVITGVGAVTPIGTAVDGLWAGLQARTSAVYMALAPFAVMVMYYFFIDPENTERLFVTVPGQLILCTSLVFNLVAYLWARKILNADI